MSEETKQPTIENWNLISTNMDNNVVHDVTRDDLIGIIMNAFKYSNAYRVTDILDVILEHTKGYGEGDPHETTLDQLSETVIDKLYDFWLNRGYNGTPDDLRSVIYTYLEYASGLALYVGQRPQTVTTVKAVADYIKQHNDAINTYNDISLFTISERDTKWTSGVISGMQVQTDGSLLSVPDTTPTIYPNPNGENFYTWVVSVPKRFGGSHVSVNVDTTSPYTVQYRILGLTDWKELKDGIDENISNNSFLLNEFATPEVPNTLGVMKKVDWSNVYNYRNPLATNLEKLLTLREDLVFPDGTTVKDILSPSSVEGEDTPRLPTLEDVFEALKTLENELLEIEFKVTFSDETVSVKDVITTIDASKVLTDDPLKIEYYRDIPHANIWHDFFTCGDPLTPTFAWFNHINSAYPSKDIDWFSHTEGSFALTVQTNANFLTPLNDNQGYTRTTRTELFKVLGESNSSLILSFLVSGLYPTEEPVDASSIYRLDGIQFEIKATYRDNEAIFYSPNVVGVNRPLWKLFFRYNLLSADFDIYYSDGTTVRHYQEMLIKYLYMDPVEWSVPTPARVENNSFIGLHSLYYYNKRIFDTDFIESITRTDPQEIPYLPPYTVI